MKFYPQNLQAGDPAFYAAVGVARDNGKRLRSAYAPGRGPASSCYACADLVLTHDEFIE